MEVGHLQQKANPYLVVFVLGCAVIIIGLLFVMQKSEALAEGLSSKENIVQYIDL